MIKEEHRRMSSCDSKTLKRKINIRLENRKHLNQVEEYFTQVPLVSILRFDLISLMMLWPFVFL